MTASLLPLVALVVFLGLPYPISCAATQLMILPPAQSELAPRFQFSLVDWLALAVLLQIVFALAGSIRHRPTTMWDWIPLLYFLASVTLCWWASVPELTRGAVKHPVHRFLWLLCL